MPRLPILLGLVAICLASAASATTLEEHQHLLLYQNELIPYYAKQFLPTSLNPAEDTPEYLQGLLETAQNQIRQKHWEPARTTLTQVTHLGSGQSAGRQAAFLLAELDSIQGKNDAASQALQAMLSDPSNDFLNNLIRTRLATIDLQNKRATDAIKILDTLSAKVQGYDEALFIKALALLSSQQPGLTVELLEKLSFRRADAEGQRALFLGEAYYFSEKYDDAISHYDGVLADNGVSDTIKVAAAYGRAMSVYHAKTPSLAKPVLEAFVKNYPNSSFVGIIQFHIALLDEKLGNSQTAANILKQLKVDALSQSSQLGAIRNLFKSGQFGECAEMARRFRNRFPNSDYVENVLVYESQSQLQLGHYEPAGRLFDMLATRYSTRKDLAKIVYKMGYAYLRAQNYQKALSAFDRYLTLSKDVDNVYRQALILKAESLYQLQNFGYAIDVYNTAYKNTKDENIRQHILFGLGWCYFKQRQFDDSVNAFLQAIALNPQNPIAQTAWFKIAECHTRLGNLAQARLVYEDIENRLPALAGKAAWDKAMMYYRASQFSDARGLLQEFLQHYPYDQRGAETFYWLGWAYYRENKTPEAVQTFSDLKSKFPSSKFGREADFRIADSYFNGKQWDAAAAAYRLALDNPQWAEDAYYGLVLAQIKLGQTQAAQESFNQYVARFPNGVLIGELKDKLQP